MGQKRTTTGRWLRPTRLRLERAHFLDPQKFVDPSSSLRRQIYAVVQFRSQSRNEHVHSDLLVVFFSAKDFDVKDFTVNRMAFYDAQMAQENVLSDRKSFLRSGMIRDRAVADHEHPISDQELSAEVGLFRPSFGVHPSPDRHRP